MSAHVDLSRYTGTTQFYVFPVGSSLDTRSPVAFPQFEGLVIDATAADARGRYGVATPVDLFTDFVTITPYRTVPCELPLYKCHQISPTKVNVRCIIRVPIQLIIQIKPFRAFNSSNM